jgi:hypothetical protein
VLTVNQVPSAQKYRITSFKAAIDEGSSGISHGGKSNPNGHSMEEFILAYGGCVKSCPIVLSYDKLKLSRTPVSILVPRTDR